MSKTNIIAEVGSVHDGSFGNAIKLIELAAALEVDAVKFQTHIPEEETLRSAPSPGYFSSENRFDYFARTGFDKYQWAELKACADENGLAFISSPFSQLAVEWLLDIGASALKVASGEVTNLPMLQAMSDTGVPVLLSSGMSDWDEISVAVETLSGADITLMQCSSSYPCSYSDVGLNVLAEMRERYGIPVGFSDHTETNYAAFSAVAQGAVCIEKHLTFSKAMYGSDAPLAAEPEQFRDLVAGIRAITAINASAVDKSDSASYTDMKQIFQKSIVARRDIAAGEILSADALAYKKPGNGLSAARYKEVIGKKAKSAINQDDFIQLTDIK
jgi:N,N'-diacetyllegionaminate synthase